MKQSLKLLFPVVVKQISAWILNFGYELVITIQQVFWIMHTKC
jgi:hypothetical protein